MIKLEKKITPQISDKDLDILAKTAGEEVNKQEKIKVRIPIDPLNKTDLIVPVIINGYVWNIERVKSVLLPENVVTILEEAGYI